MCKKMWVGTYSTHLKSYILVFHIENVALLNLIFFFLLNKIYFSSHSDFQKRGGFTGYAYPYFFIYILTIYYPNTAALSSVPSAVSAVSFTRCHYSQLQY